MLDQLDTAAAGLEISATYYKEYWRTTGRKTHHNSFCVRPNTNTNQVKFTCDTKIHIIVYKRSKIEKNYQRKDTKPAKAVLRGALSTKL